MRPGHSSPSIWGGYLFITSFDDGAKKLDVLAYDRQTGPIRWRQVVPAKGIEKVHEVSNPATATPVVYGARVYAYFGSAGLFCYDLQGKLVWSRPMPVAEVGFGNGTSPVIADDTLILARDDGERHMLALERKTGKLLWDVKLGGSVQQQFDSHATPVLWKDQIILHRAGEVAAFDLRDGSRRWWVNVSSAGTSMPVIHNGVLFVGAWFGAPDLVDPMPSWETLLEKYDKDGNGKLSKDEFPDDLAIARRVDARRGGYHQDVLRRARYRQGWATLQNGMGSLRERILGSRNIAAWTTCDSIGRREGCDEDECGLERRSRRLGSSRAVDLPRPCLCGNQRRHRLGVQHPESCSIAAAWAPAVSTTHRRSPPVITFTSPPGKAL